MIPKISLWDPLQKDLGKTPITNCCMLNHFEKRSQSPRQSINEHCNVSVVKYFQLSTEETEQDKEYRKQDCELKTGPQPNRVVGMREVLIHRQQRKGKCLGKRRPSVLLNQLREPLWDPARDWFGLSLFLTPIPMLSPVSWMSQKDPARAYPSGPTPSSYRRLSLRR